METNPVLLFVIAAIASFIGGMIGFRIIFPMMVARGTPKRRPPEFYRSIATATPNPVHTGDTPVDNAPKQPTDEQYKKNITEYVERMTLHPNMDRPLSEIIDAVPFHIRGALVSGERWIRTEVREDGRATVDIMKQAGADGSYGKTYASKAELENDPVVIYYYACVRPEIERKKKEREETELARIDRIEMAAIATQQSVSNDANTTQEG